ncbi:hypothetical protein [Streptomyces sp. 135]|uniref:hypothetical protein n=1 Tax=Streptomyces sp. 135 TaxID=2838850 RepID=UPI003209109C
MSATTDSAGHPEVAEISDLTEGLLSPSRTSDVRRHLDGCALCADVYASLEEIRGMLGTLPGPPRMPVDVAGRIDAALAAEALLDATAPDGPSTPAAPELASAAPARTPAPHVSRETSPPSAPAAVSARPVIVPPGDRVRPPGRGAVALRGAHGAVPPCSAPSSPLPPSASALC